MENQLSKFCKKGGERWVRIVSNQLRGIGHNGETPLNWVKTSGKVKHQKGYQK